MQTNVQQLERIFGGHKGGVIIHASEEQIREMMRKRGFSAGSMSAPEHPKPFNLRNQKPDFENENGRFTIAGPKNYPFLDALDVSVGLADLNPVSAQCLWKTRLSQRILLLNSIICSELVNLFFSKM